MKKQYIKPELFIESFNMAQSIALACNGYVPGNTTSVANHRTYETCSFTTGGFNYFTNTTTCKDVEEDPDDIGYGCYNNLDTATQAFSSI